MVLDNLESILETDPVTTSSCYRHNYEDYDRLIELVGETQHESCLLLTSREKPEKFSILEADILQVRCLQ